MKVFVGLLGLIGMLCLFGQPVKAQDETGMLSASISNSLVTGINRNHKNVYNDFSVTGIYKWGIYEWIENIRSTLDLGFVKSFTQERKAFLKDAVLGTSISDIYTHPETEITLNGYGKLFLPLSKESQKRSQIFALTTGLGLSKDLSQFHFGYDLSGTYFANRFRTAKNGTSNKHYGMTNTLLVGFAFTDALALNTAWSLLNFATYNKSPKATYSFVQSLDYQATDALGLSLGHSAGGRQYKNNGQELNIELFDVEGSELFFGLNWGLNWGLN
jgi:hypothetical protein